MSTADMFIEKGRKLGIETGKKIGFEQGLEKGIETGIEKGMQKGIERGLESGKMAFVMNLLKNTEFDTAKIAALADVSEEYVEAIREGFRKE